MSAARFIPWILGLALGTQALASGDSSDLLSDTWVATDGLGRVLPGRAECGPPRSGRCVGIFYFLWLGQHGTGGPYDITKLLAANPASPAWGPVNAFHHWGESELGYYLSNDAYVIRRHCQMLVDAGVDTLIFDVTNGSTYTSNYMLVCSTFSQIRAEGGRTPQICFLANSSSATVVQKLYTDFYKKNLYSDLWFRWLNKPLVLSKPDGLSQTVQNFFTFRQSWAWSGTTWFGTGQDKWPWLDNYPQAYGWHVPGVPEEVPAAVAQHPTTNIGRSFHGGSQPAHDVYGLTGTQDQGLCFAEQAERALQVDPEFLFITGWNEWVAQRFVSAGGGDGFLGQPLPAGGTYFVDAYNQEYSRDIEPMKGGHTDNYYYQMVGLIRRFKGVRQLEEPTPARTIVIDGTFSDWTSVAPEYWDTLYDTTTRSHAGWGSAGTYLNTTGRNDVVRTKVAYDANDVYFYVETCANITSPTGANWMLLFIDADHNHATGWEGYDFLVNNSVVNSNTTTLKTNTGGGWNWTLVTNVSYGMAGNKMEVRLPRSALGLTGANLVFDFHWADNLQQLGNVVDFAVSGDSAPNRRANYRFNTLAGPPGPVTEFSATPQLQGNLLRWTNPNVADFARTIVRFSTTGYPGLTDGQLLADVSGSPGTRMEYTHHGLIPGPTWYYAAFARDLDGIDSAAALATARIVPADYDSDGDVDQADYGLFQACLSGAGTPYATGCEPMDFDYDGDVDLMDFMQFQGCLGGPDQPPGC